MSFIFDAINWKLKIMKKWLCKICFLWENKNRTVVIFLLVGLFVSLGFVYVLLVRNKRLNKENRLLQRQYEAVDNALFRMEEMQKTYLQYENMKKIDDIDLKTETDSILKLSSLLDDKKKIVVRISNAACVSCIQDFCAVLFQYFSGSEIIYISDYIEPMRSKASNLEEVRKMAFVDLDETLFKILSDTLVYLEKSSKKMDPMTMQTYEYYREQRDSAK